MRLINAEDLCVYIADWQLTESPEEGINYTQGRTVTDHEMKFSEYLLIGEFAEVVNEQPTIEAIPIDWMLSWNYDHYGGLEALLGTNVTDIEEMVDDWKKERERDDVSVE